MSAYIAPLASPTMSNWPISVKFTATLLIREITVQNIYNLYYTKVKNSKRGSSQHPNGKIDYSLLPLTWKVHYPASSQISCLLRQRLGGDILPTRRTTHVSKLVDRDGLIGGIAVGIKALVPGDAVIVGLGDLIDYSLAERAGRSKVSRVGGRLSPGLDSGFDGVEQNLRAVITTSAISAQRAILRLILLNEAGSRWNLGRINSSNGTIDRTAARSADSSGKRTRLDTITACKWGLRQTRNTNHLLANLSTACRINTRVINDIRMGSCDFRQFACVVGGTLDTIMPKHFSTESIPFLNESVGEAHTIGFSVVNDVDVMQVKRLVQVISHHRSLVVIGGRDTEVRHFTCWTQGRYQIVFAGASGSRSILGQAGVGVRRANQRDWCLVSNRHFGSRHATIERTNNTSHLRVANQRGNVCSSNGWIMRTVRADIILWVENKRVTWQEI